MDGHVWLWDAAGKELGQCQGHKKWITSLVRGTRGGVVCGALDFLPWNGPVKVQGTRVWPAPGAQAGTPAPGLLLAALWRLTPASNWTTKPWISTVLLAGWSWPNRYPKYRPHSQHKPWPVRTHLPLPPTPLPQAWEPAHKALPCQRFASASRDSTIRVWDAQTRCAPSPHRSPRLRACRPVPLAVRPAHLLLLLAPPFQHPPPRPSHPPTHTHTHLHNAAGAACSA
jgi:hypothetical protein